MASSRLWSIILILISCTTYLSSADCCNCVNTTSSPNGTPLCQSDGGTCAAAICGSSGLQHCCSSDWDLTCAYYAEQLCNANSTTSVPSTSSSCSVSAIILGVDTYSPSNLNLNGKLDLSAELNYSGNCSTSGDGESGIIYNWMVTAMVSGNTQLNSLKYSQLTSFISEEGDTDSLSIDADSYLQSGVEYHFVLELDCSGQYQCSDGNQEVKEVDYPYEDIECGIASNDVALFGVDPLDLVDLLIGINGASFTFDPLSSDSSDKDHLSWTWDCTDSCDSMVDDSVDSTASKIELDFSKLSWEYDVNYTYTLAMTVTDDTNADRGNCTDSMKIQIVTKSYNDAANEEALYMVSITAIESEVNVADRLRLIGDVLNEDLSTLISDHFVEFEWTEVNGLLSDDQISDFQQSSESSPHLILEENKLQTDTQYAFRLAVSAYSDALRSLRIGYGQSTAITVNTLSTPSIDTSSPLSIQPADCVYPGGTGCEVTFSSILEWFEGVQSIHIAANSSYLPLLYQFGYLPDIIFHSHASHNSAEPIYFESGYVYEGTISDVILPLGDYSIFANVIDAKSTITSQKVILSVNLNSYSECLAFAVDVVTPIFEDSTLSESEKFALFFQRAIAYISYLDSYDGADANCVEDGLTDILDALSDHILPSVDALCSTVYPISFAQTLTKWMEFVNASPAMASIFYIVNTNKYNTLQDLLYGALDPCEYIVEELDSVESLTVSQESIVTKKPMIFDDGTDITSKLEPILTDPGYHTVLHCLASAILVQFEYFEYDSTVDLQNVLSDALYVAELASLSVCIPGESIYSEYDEFTVYSTRVDGESVDVSMQNMDITIPSAVTHGSLDSSRDDLFTSFTDVHIVGFNVTSTNNSAPFEIVGSDAANAECEGTGGETKEEGTISHQAVSITVQNDEISTASLPSNINITFRGDAIVGPGSSSSKSDNTADALCFWYDEDADLWSNSGCTSTRDVMTGDVFCSCSHLTTFATIHNLHRECNEYVDEWRSSDLWDYFNLMIGSVFLFIFVYSFYEIYPFWKKRHELKWKKHRAMFAIFMIGVTAFLYILVCVQAYITKMHFTLVTIKVYTFFLLLPQLTLFMVFSMIFYTWFTLAHSFLVNLQDLKQMVRIILLTVNIAVWIILLVYYILTFFNDDIFEYGTYIMSGIISGFAVITVVYSMLVGHVLWNAAQISKDQSFANKEWKVVRRLLVINGFIAIYFCFQSFTIIYLAVDPDHQSVAYDLVYLTVNAVCLLVIIWMYRASVKHLIKEDQEKSNRDKSKSNVLSGTGGLSETNPVRRTMSPRRFTHTLTQAMKRRVTRENTVTATEPATPGPTSPRLPVYPSNNLSSHKPAVGMMHRSVTPMRCISATPTARNDVSHQNGWGHHDHSLKLANRRTSHNLTESGSIDAGHGRPSASTQLGVRASIDPSINGNYGMNMVCYDENARPSQQQLPRDSHYQQALHRPSHYHPPPPPPGPPAPALAPGGIVNGLSSNSNANSNRSSAEMSRVSTTKISPHIARKLSTLMLGGKGARKSGKGTKAKKKRPSTKLERTVSHSQSQDDDDDDVADALPAAMGQTRGGPSSPPFRSPPHGPGIPARPSCVMTAGGPMVTSGGHMNDSTKSIHSDEGQQESSTQIVYSDEPGLENHSSYAL